jgi:hypothetical protein
MDALLWILIGLAGGLAISSLAPQMHQPSLSDAGWHRVRAAAAGVIGAVAAGYALVLVDPSLRTEGLTTAIGSLAGALCLAAVVEAYASRRRRGESSEAPALEPSGVRTALETPAYDMAREALVAGLLEDAAAHETGRYAEIGRQLPAISDTMSRQDPSRNRRLQLALRFWNRWTDARDQHWQSRGVENPIAVGDWPRFARVIASDLALDRDTRDPVILARFA